MQRKNLILRLIYDGLGRRAEIIERAGAGGAISSVKTFVYDGWQLLEQRDGNNAVVTRYFAQGEQRLTGSDAGNYFCTYDHLGSVREFLDGSRGVRARYDYDVWGNRTKLSGDLECEIGFTGYWNHAPSGLYLSPTRAYSSALGRFISRDPLGEKGGLNLYGYVGNDPVNEVDSTGLYVTYSPGDYTNWNAQFANYWKNSGAFREKWHRMQVSPYYFNFTPDGSPLTPSTISGSGNLRVDDDGSGPSHDDPNHQTSTSCRRHGRSLNADRDSYIVAPGDLFHLGVNAGDRATITVNGQSVNAPIGDFGPVANGFGEASIAAVHGLGLRTTDAPHVGPVIPGGAVFPSTVVIHPTGSILDR